MYSDEDNNSRKAESKNNKYELTDDCIDSNSLSTLKRYYEKGLILSTTNNGASSSSAFVGHASIMHHDKWSSDWDEHGLSKVFCTAWPNLSGQMTWEGKINGVQEEPLAVWAGNKKCCIKNVNIQRARRMKNSKNGNTIYTAATKSEGNTAAEYAKSKIKVPYSVVWHSGLDYDDRFYCSKLVYKSYTSISDEFKIPNFLWVTPADLLNNTDNVVSYTNNLTKD